MEKLQRKKSLKLFSMTARLLFSWKFWWFLEVSSTSLPHHSIFQCKHLQSAMHFARWISAACLSHDRDRRYRQKLTCTMSVKCSKLCRVCTFNLISDAHKLKRKVKWKQRKNVFFFALYRICRLNSKKRRTEPDGGRRGKSLHICRKIHSKCIKYHPHQTWLKSWNRFFLFFHQASEFIVVDFINMTPLALITGRDISIKFYNKKNFILQYVCLVCARLAEMNHPKIPRASEFKIHDCFTTRTHFSHNSAKNVEEIHSQPFTNSIRSARSRSLMNSFSACFHLLDIHTWLSACVGRKYCELL